MAAIKARGYPVAFEASAEERDNRAFTYQKAILALFVLVACVMTDLDDAILLRRGVERILDIAFTHDAQVPNDVDGGRT